MVVALYWRWGEQLYIFKRSANINNKRAQKGVRRIGVKRGIGSSRQEFVLNTSLLKAIDTNAART